MTATQKRNNPWSAEEDEKLHAYRKQGLTTKEIAPLLDRTHKSVAGRWCFLNYDDKPVGTAAPERHAQAHGVQARAAARAGRPCRGAGRAGGPDAGAYQHHGVCMRRSGAESVRAGTEGIAMTIAPLATSIWTTRPELDVALKALWADHSATQILSRLNEQFDVSLSRNAVLGRLARLGLTVKDKTEIAPYTRGVIRTRVRRVRTVVAKPKPAPVVCEAVPSLELTLDELKFDSCRYIAGDDYLYCGHTAFKRSMCGFHFAVCYWRPGEKRV